MSGYIYVASAGRTLVVTFASILPPIQLTIVRLLRELSFRPLIHPSIPPSIEIQSGSPFINLDGPILEVELGVKLDLIPETKNFELKSVHIVQDKRKRGSPDLSTDSDVSAEFDNKDSHKKSAPSVS